MKDSTEKRKEYRRKWMSEWRKKNKDKAKEIQTRYWKKKLEKLDKEADAIWDENTEVKEDGDESNDKDSR